MKQGLHFLILLFIITPPSFATDRYSLDAEVGGGYNSNIYRTPDKVYFDYFAGNTPTQNLQSGIYVPLSLDGKYLHSGDTNYEVDYQLDSEFFVDGAYSNGNTFEHELKGKFEKKLKGQKRKKINGEFFIHSRNKDYYDRDTGDDKISGGGEDLTDRFSYLSMGVNGDYSIKSGAMQYEIGGFFENRNYAPVVAVSEYDYTDLGLSLAAEYRISRGNKFKVKYTLSSVDFKDREARDLTGSQAGIRPKLTYLYNTVKFSLRNKIGSNWVSRLNYQISHRVDGDVGYNDRLRNSIGANLIHRGNKLRNKFRLAYLFDDYARAWAFDTDTSGITKTYDSFLAKYNVDYQFSKKIYVGANLEYRDTNSNDTRYDYERLKFETSIKWVIR